MAEVETEVGLRKVEKVSRLKGTHEGVGPGIRGSGLSARPTADHHTYRGHQAGDHKGSRRAALYLVVRLSVLVTTQDT